MLTEVRVRDFKSFGGDHSLPLRPLTVLLGKNNSGKTAIARLPIAFLRSVGLGNQPTQVAGEVAFGDLGLGASLVDTIHGQQPHRTLALGLSVAGEDLRASSVDVVLQHLQTLLGSRTVLKSFESRQPDLSVRFSLDQRMTAAGLPYSPPISQTRGLLPIPRDRQQRAAALDLAEHLGDLAARASHLHSIRAAVRPAYEVRDPHLDDPQGSEAPYRLLAESELLGETQQWYAKNLGVVLDLVTEANSFYLAFGTSRAPSVNLARAGQGLQQVLPVVALLKRARLNSGTKQLLVIEEPELHLHPSAHGAAADLFSEAVQTSNTQVIVETHSENFILRLRRRVATGQLDHEKVNLIWVDEQDGQSTLHEILIREDGSVTDWPIGVFAEDLEEVRAIARAQR